MHRIAIVLLLALLWPAAARAQSCTASAGTMAFGTIAGTPIAQTDVAPNLTVSCSGGPNNSIRRVCVGITAGSGTGSSIGTRYLSSGANTLQFQVYADSARTVVWGTHLDPAGDEQLVSVPLNAAGSGSVTVPMYGRIPNPPAHSPATGSYSSSLGFAGRLPNGGSACNSGNAGVGTFTGGSFAASATVEAACTISAAPIAFGSASSLASAITGSGNIRVTCTLNAPYVIALNAGSTTGNSITARKMSLGGAGAGVVSYQLYKPPGYSTVWGDGSAGSSVQNGTGTGAVQDWPVNAQVPAQATPAQGSYQDTVTATVTF
jgi:spore coat protein U-like protein